MSIHSKSKHQQALVVLARQVCNWTRYSGAIRILSDQRGPRG